MPRGTCGRQEQGNARSAKVPHQTRAVPATPSVVPGSGVVLCHRLTDLEQAGRARHADPCPHTQALPGGLKRQ